MSDEHGAEEAPATPAGPPLVDLNKAVSNERLVEAMGASFAERTQEAAERLWAELNEADFLVAVYPAASGASREEVAEDTALPGGTGGAAAEGEAAPDDKPVDVMSATDATGAVYLPLFTDWEAIAAYTQDEVLTLVMPADEAWSWVLETEEYAGVVINPGGQALTLDKGQLGYLMHLVGRQQASAQAAGAGASRAGAVEARRERDVRFVGEQDGPAEQELKLVLSDLFARTPAVTRAYLARVDYGVPGPYEVALCLRGDEDPVLLGGISRQFGSLFGEDVHMDVLFLDDELEARLRTVCAPFYAGGEDAGGESGGRTSRSGDT